MSNERGEKGSGVARELTMSDGRFTRPIAMRHPGMFLSQPGTVIRPSYHCAPITVSIESAIRSRDYRPGTHSTRVSVGITTWAMAHVDETSWQHVDDKRDWVSGGGRRQWRMIPSTCSEKDMPGVPMEIPSETPIVLNRSPIIDSCKSRTR
jgi:hypothetical protein